MIDANDLARRYVESWNEVDSDARRRIVDGLWTDDARYADPMMTADGPDGIAALIGGVHARFPGHRFTLSGPADGFGSNIRFSWSLGPADGPVVARGTDFAVVAADGRLVRVTGFLDQVPYPLDCGSASALIAEILRS
jgi:hypothetical protein